MLILDMWIGNSCIKGQRPLFIFTFQVRFAEHLEERGSIVKKSTCYSKQSQFPKWAGFFAHSKVISSGEKLYLLLTKKNLYRMGVFNFLNGVEIDIKIKYSNLFYFVFLVLSQSSCNNATNNTQQEDLAISDFYKYEYPCNWRSNVVIGFDASKNMRICTYSKSSLRKGEYDLASCGDGTWEYINDSTINISNIRNEYGADWSQYNGTYDIYICPGFGGEPLLNISKSTLTKYYNGYVPPEEVQGFYFYGSSDRKYHVFK
jgi:hypothetical protein